MENISGTLNVYFPFELKDTWGIRCIRRHYDSVRDTQIKQLRNSQRPRTDMMDMVALRYQMESIVGQGQKLMGGVGDPNSVPYATKCVAEAYHHSREDNLFVKEPSVVVSRFNAICPGVNSEQNPLDGILYYFNNLGNNVGVYVLALRFSNITVDDVIRLKHAFYKRAEAIIKEIPITCEEQNLLDGRMTFQEYVCYKAKGQKYRRKTDIDYRARYTFVEIEKTDLKEDTIYGLLTSNEKYLLLGKDKGKLIDYSNYSTYSLYYNLRSGLIINHVAETKVRQRRKDFFNSMSFGEDHIPVVILEGDGMIAGLSQGKFPAFLKSVELHFLTNNAQRHETVRHELSYWNPYKVTKRRFRLWRIFKELDVSNCFIDGNMTRNFGVEEDLKKLKEEYSQLSGHIVSYASLLISIGALFVAIMSLLKVNPLCQ